jgi:hypothetical protein
LTIPRSGSSKEIFPNKTEPKSFSCQAQLAAVRIIINPE